MPGDALTYSILANELDRTLTNARIERVSMPEKDEVVLSVRTKSNEKFLSRKLLLSCSPANARIHFTDEEIINPTASFSFLMHLRKRIAGGVIKNVRTIPFERVVIFSIDARDELGEAHAYSLYAEIMGKYSNILLVDENQKITDAIKKNSFDDEAKRLILPGTTYTLPPPQEEKISPFSPDAVKKIETEGSGDAVKFIISSFLGFAPSSVRQALFDSVGSTTPSESEVRKNAEKIVYALRSLYDCYSPCVRLGNDGKPLDFSIKPYTHEGELFRSVGTLSEAIRLYFSMKESATSLSNKRNFLVSQVKNAIKKAEKAITLLKEKILACEDLEQDRIEGELITAYMYAIKFGEKSVTLDNYYDGNKITITLDPTLSPQKNAQRYYKQYAKKKSAIAHSEAQVAEYLEKSDYYHSILASLDSSCDESSLGEIAVEMENAGISKRTKKNVKQRKSSPHSFEIDGFSVKIGKNNTQNDALVKKSDGGYLWLHTQKIHGSHGIIEGQNVPQDTVNKVAALVAHFSKAALSSNVPVDYTLVKYVKKPTGSPPGKVIYTHQQTVNVVPKSPEELGLATKK